MNELAKYQRELPDTMDDLMKFLLIAPVKAVAIKAEIRALKNLKTAEYVLEQKRHEQRVLAELMLDAKTKVGELTSALPIGSYDRGNQYKSGSPTLVSGSHKSKTQVVSESGLSQKQVERYETLAKNKDLVEQVKAESRESGTMPTAKRVISLAQARKEKAASELISDLKEINRNRSNLAKLRKALSNPTLYGFLNDSDETLASAVKAEGDFDDLVKDIDQYLFVLQKIKSKLIALKGGYYEW